MLDQPERRSPMGGLIEEDKAIAVAITIQSQVNQRRSIVMQTYLDRDAPLSEFHALADKLSGVTDRQEAKFDLMGARDKLLIDERSLALAEAQFQAIDARNAAEWKAKKKQGEPTLSHAERVAKDNTAETIKAARKGIEALKVEITELEAKIAKVD